MRKLTNLPRVERLIRNAISEFKVDLNGISVLTEAASGSFAVTCLIAAMARADHVFAVTRDSRHGKAEEVIKYTMELARYFNVENQIIATSESPAKYASHANLVTNLGFVRPINKELIELLPKDSAISLMWEPWEFRSEDIDLEACRTRGIPVLGTCETHPQLQTFRFVGILALKLLLEAEIEVFRSKILVIGSGHFGIEIMNVMKANEAEAMLYDPTSLAVFPELKEYIKLCDGIIIAEHRVHHCVLGGDTGIPLNWINHDTKIIHVCGEIDAKAMEESGLTKSPPQNVTPGFMTYTTDYVGPRPLIDLHTAGLKVGEEMVRSMRQKNDSRQAVKDAIKASPAMDFN